jgi:lipid-A-disaccharide synthase
LTQQQARSVLGLDAARRTIALLPGSRKSELVHLLPDMLKAAKVLSSRFPDLQFVLPLAPTLEREFVLAFVAQGDVPVRMVEGRVYDVLRASDAAIVASGTATLETGLMAVPMVIVYRISALNYFILTKLVRGVKNVGLVNIVANKRLVPELVQRESTPENIADALMNILDDPARYQQIRGQLAGIRAQLGEAGASRRAASIVLEFLKGSDRV